jgi:hypothetical protein
MKYFLLTTIISTFLLLWSPPIPISPQSPKREFPSLFAKQKTPFKESFDAAENGHVAWALMTGEKNGITPRTKNHFQQLQIGSLLSPSGLHFSTLLLLVGFFIQKIVRKKFSRKIRFCFLVIFYFLPFLTMKRIILFRIFMMIRNQYKIKCSLEILFFFTFFVAFLLGHFKQSPLGFVFSFLFMGTFISLRDHPRLFSLMAIFASHQLICLFTSGSVSPWALLLNIPFLGFFPLLFVATIVYFVSYQFVAINWLEPLMRFFIVSVHQVAKLIQGSEWDASLSLVLAIWMILLKKPKRYFVIFLILHSAWVKAPTFILTGHS